MHDRFFVTFIFKNCYVIIPNLGMDDEITIHYWNESSITVDWLWKVAVYEIYEEPLICL